MSYRKKRLLLIQILLFTTAILLMYIFYYQGNSNDKEVEKAIVSSPRPVLITILLIPLKDWEIDSGGEIDPVGGIDLRVIFPLLIPMFKLSLKLPRVLVKVTLSPTTLVENFMVKSPAKSLTAIASVSISPISYSKS